jgi:alkylation response protein AidB-like acyl-CoA dehydrogenase
MNPFELRRLDFSLGEEQEALRDTFAGFLAKECPTSVVRAAEPLGHDPRLWEKLASMGALSMAVPEAAGGEGAGVVDLALVAEEIGRVLAPVPLIEHVVAARLLAGAGSSEAMELVAAALDGSTILGLSLNDLGVPRLVSSAAVADAVVGLDGDQVVVLHAPDGGWSHARNQGNQPWGWVSPHDRRTAVTSAVPAAELLDRAGREWRTITAAALVGMTQGALALALDFVKTRRTLGVVIATLQGVSFPLADVQIGITGARNLYRRTAWFLDVEPDSEPWLPAAALAYASKVATHGVTASQHAQGGLGFTIEADSSLFFLRAKGWAQAAGDLRDDLETVGRLALAAASGQ